MKRRNDLSDSKTIVRYFRYPRCWLRRIRYPGMWRRVIW